MAKTFRPYDPDQLLMMPPSVREWLPEDHVVYFVSDVVETLELSAIHDRYAEERGFPPYHPLLMTKLLVYGYVRGVRSSRKLARACLENVDFRVLAAGQRPDFRTIAAFRARHVESIEGLFVQVLRLCEEAGLVELSHVAVDSTKIRANASKHKAMSYARMEQESERLRAEIRRELEKWAANDAREDALYGDRRGDELPPHLVDRKQRLQVIQEAKAALEAEAREKAKGKPSQEPPKPDPKAQRNFTDPESRIMLSSDKAFIQAYSAQLAVEAGSQVIVACEVTQTSADQGQLVPMVEQVEAHTGKRPEAVSADGGYWAQEQVERLEAGGTEAFVAPKKYRHSEWRDRKPPRGRMPKHLSAKERMDRKLRTKRGRAEYDKRKVTVEPVCGQIKAALGFRQFSLRGHRKVRGEWKLVSTAHNLLKLYRSGWRPHNGGLQLAVAGGAGP